MNSIQAVAFDVDGTLYSEPMLYLRAIPFAVRNRRTISCFRAIRSELHRPNAALSDDIRHWQTVEFARRTGVSIEEGRREIDRVIYNEWMEQVCRIPLLSCVRQTLGLLSVHRLPLAVLSDFPPERKLRHWGVDEEFAVALNSETSGALKPHSRPFLLLAEMLSLPPRAILYVGNNPRYDIAPAHALGFSTAYYRDPRIIHSRRRTAVIPDATFTFTRYRDVQRYILQRLS